ncbi:hypothetical protein SAMN04515667_2108 [Formosa sp. Hel1_31_208]|uniref:hypothetical protein n=1 Tax=Formosa sp. Hel1_31_208 TaxID=1798225 RepID=UPI0008794FD8|nr:hypothetical protein [Formosa sp. Hel1_31_208]SDS40816.1 hypothetical protein SAMN04515667_2108 [Formosa sp. Hel1_31_208]
MKISVISILIIGIAIFIAAREKDNPLYQFINTEKDSKITAKEFVNKIDALGYFKYTETKNLNALKQNHLESFSQGGSWGGIWDEETNLPLDNRYYICDGESVYEQDGFTEMLDEMKSTLEKIGFTLHIDDHFEEWDNQNEWLNHRITINGNEYVIFKNFKGYGWGEAVQRLAEILNSEFKKQNIAERVYLINGGNDGSLIFLDDDLYHYFYNVFTDPQWKPLEVNEWMEVMGVKPMKLD